MIVAIPGNKTLDIQHLLLDYNGTLAVDGVLIGSVKVLLDQIHALGIQIHIVTADTHGSVRSQCADMPVTIQIFDKDDAANSKREIVRKLEGDQCMSIGNGYNDRLMFEASGLAVAVIGDEGCAVKALSSADILCTKIEDALHLILNQKRVIATLRG